MGNLRFFRVFVPRARLGVWTLYLRLLSPKIPVACGWREGLLRSETALTSTLPQHDPNTEKPYNSGAGLLSPHRDPIQSFR